MFTGKLLKLIREIYNISPFRKYFFYRYHYMFNPSQLIFLCECVKKTKDVDGIIFELGCAEGRTTVFLKKYMESEKISKDYYCLDTFSGFTQTDINFEADKRNKDENVLKVQFVANKKEWVDKTLTENGIHNVKTFEADINTFNMENNNIKKISFCLIDVDLYKPVLSALHKVYDLMEKGGIIVIDDCKPDKYYDGALEAYLEFTKEKNIEPKIMYDKLGVIEF